MHYCFSAVTAAQENVSADSSSATKIIENTSEENSQQADEKIAELAEGQSKDQAEEQAIAPIPQPPLIDAQPEPGYQPDTNDSASEESINQTAGQPAEQAVAPIPQPPLIDAQPEPSYEPDTNDSIDEGSASTIQTAEPATATEELTTEQKQQEETEKTGQVTRWSDTRPALVSADWLQLKSGEWLRGRIIAMQEDDLEFESDELKKLVIEWKKVRYLKSSQPYRLRFDNGALEIGAIEITQKEIHITTDYDDKTFERSKLLTIASGKETEISHWSSKITFSINVRRGNTDQTDFTSKINAKRQTVYSRVVLDYLGNFTEIEGSETINNHRLNGIYNIFITRHFFLPLVSAEYFRDPFQNIEKRVYIGTGVGYSLIKTIKTKWDVSGGPAFQSTKFVSVQPDQEQKDNAITLVLLTIFETKLNSKVDLEGSYAATLGDEATGNYSHHSIFTVETELTNDLDFDVSLVWDRTRQPVANAEGVIPEQDDFRFLIGLGYDL